MSTSKETDFFKPHQYIDPSLYNRASLFFLFISSLTDKIKEEIGVDVYTNLTDIKNIEYKNYINTMSQHTYFKVFMLDGIGKIYINLNYTIAQKIINNLLGNKSITTGNKYLTSDDLILLDALLDPILPNLLKKSFSQINGKKPRVCSFTTYLNPSLCYHYDEEDKGIGIFWSMKLLPSISEDNISIFLDQNIIEWLQSHTKKETKKIAISSIPLELECVVTPENPSLKDLLIIMKVGNTIKIPEKLFFKLDNKKILEGVKKENEIIIVKNYCR
jgi:flagellar motor switch protein FliM